MKLNVNGEEQDVEVSGTAVDALLSALEIHEVRGVAIAVNDRVIPRSQWGEFALQDGDRVEIIRATQGG